MSNKTNPASRLSSTRLYSFLTIALLLACIFTKYRYSTHNSTPKIEQIIDNDKDRCENFCLSIEKGRYKEVIPQLEDYDEINIFVQDSLVYGPNRYINFIPDTTFRHVLSINENGTFVHGQYQAGDSTLQYIFPIFLKATIKNPIFYNHFPRHKLIHQSYYISDTPTTYTESNMLVGGVNLYINHDENLRTKRANFNINTILAIMLSFFVFTMFYMLIYTRYRQSTIRNLFIGLVGNLLIFVLLKLLAPFYILTDISVFQQESLVSFFGFSCLWDFYNFVLAMNFFMAAMLRYYFKRVNLDNFKYPRLVQLAWLIFTFMICMFYLISSVDLVYNSIYNYFLLDLYPILAQKMFYAVIIVILIYPSYVSTHLMARYLLRTKWEVLVAFLLLAIAIFAGISSMQNEYASLSKNAWLIALLFAVMIPLNKLPALFINRKFFHWGNLVWILYLLIISITVISYSYNYKTIKTIENFVESNFHNETQEDFIPIQESLSMLQADSTLYRFSSRDSALWYIHKQYFSTQNYDIQLAYVENGVPHFLDPEDSLNTDDLDNLEILRATHAHSGLSIYEKPIYYVDQKVSTGAGDLEIIAKVKEVVESNENYVTRFLFKEESPLNYKFALYDHNKIIKTSDPKFPIFYYPKVEMDENVISYSHEGNTIKAEDKLGNQLYVVEASYYNFWTILTTCILLLVLFFVFYCIMQLLALSTRSKISARSLNLTRNLNFNQKIFVSIALLLIFVMTLISISVTNVFTRTSLNTYNKNFEQSINTMSSLLENDSLSSLLNEISLQKELDNFGYDFNVYDTKGKLRYTTNQTIFDKKIWTAYMNSIPLNKLLKERNLIIQAESFNSFKYYSGYSFFESAEGERLILNTLNLGYRDETNQGINTFINQVSLLVFFLLIMSLMVSFLLSQNIKSTLDQLVTQIQNLDFKGYNKRINWNQQDEIGRLVKEYNDMLDKLEDNVKKLAETERAYAWREMARQIAHEVKNPLTPMKLNIQHLNKIADQRPEELPAFTKRISKSLIQQIDHLAEISSDFSFFSNISNAERHPIELSEIYKGIFSLYQHQDDLEMEMLPLDREVKILANDVQLNKVYINLIKNAIEATEHATRKVVKVTHTIIDDDTVEIRVQDFGTGIPEDMKSSIFEPNFTTKSSGTGLGLVISKNIIEFHGGEITFVSTQGEGTEFIFTLPIQSFI